MKHSFIRALVAGTLLVVHAAAYAETVNTTADLLLSKNKKTFSYIYSRPMMESLCRLAIEQDKKFGLQQECKSQYVVKPFFCMVLQPIEFPADKPHPVKGLWYIHYQIQRCGESKFYNASFIASGNGDVSPTPRAYYPGESNASPQLIKDTMIAALPSALNKSGLKECKKIDVFDMRVTRKAHDVVEGDQTFKGVWNETWTFRLCGKMVDVEIMFIPDATGGGTTYVIRPSNQEKAKGKPRKTTGHPENMNL